MPTDQIQSRLDADQSQRSFHVFLQAIAEPGSIHRLDVSHLAAGVPAPAMLALTLADVEVAINVDGDASSPLGRLLCETTGARSTDTEDADLVILTGPDTDVVARCDPGTALVPERGTRLAVRVDAVRTDPRPGDLVVTLAGPGVPGSRTLGLAGVPGELLHRLAEANAAFPAGLDTWFISDEGDTCALPRSTQLTITEEN